ncbi:MAG: hypothetical protein GY696_00875 [Gammaproteobacteria bacterium]|nr:hypothetical protein [Gammaproteobacteria bacterium]
MPVHPPEDFLPTPGAVSQPWDRWIVSYTRYMHVKRLERKERLGNEAADYNNEDLNSFLYMALGKEGQRQMSSVPEGRDFTKPHTEFCNAATSLFQRRDKLHTLVARHKFQMRCQLSSESVQEYLTELRLLSSACDWVGEDDMLALVSFPDASLKR